MLKVLTWRILMLILIIYITSSLYFTYQTRLYDIRAQRKSIAYLNHTELKYILQWTRRFSAPFDYLEEGNSVFIKNKCKYTNCFVTDDRNYFTDQKFFHAVAFNGRDLDMWSFQLPQNRCPKQKYIFGAMESPDFFPACNDYLDGFFNWTWSYKLDSDFQWGYISIYDLEDNLVGPALNMNWVENMQPINDVLQTKLDTKTKAAAWFVSHCITKRGREDYVDDLKEELKKFGWTVDIFGACGTLSCPRRGEKSCNKMLENDYYFYLSFENSFAEDYVTEKLLTALNNYVVPIVYGGADYTRLHAKHWCGGAIVGLQWVLTAAQCFDYVSKEEVTVRMGSVFRDFGGRILSVIEIKRHPDYRTDQYYPEHNLAMVKVNIPIVVGSRVQTVSIATTGAELPSLFGETIVTGYGSVVTGQIREGENQELRRMIVKQMPQSECRRVYGNDYRLQHDHMCLQSVVKGVALCAGDTGDPAVHFSGVNRAGTLFGIALFSGTEECALKQKPGVYAKVSYSKVWIENVINDRDFNESLDSRDNTIPLDV